MQRLRCFPMKKTGNFKGRCFHGKNQCDLVALVPSETDYADFKYPCPSENPLEIARLQLLFEFTMLPDPEAVADSADVVQAAFVQRFAPFADERGFPLFRHDGSGSRKQQQPDLFHGLGYQIFYETTEPAGPHYYVVPIS